MKNATTFTGLPDDAVSRPSRRRLSEIATLILPVSLSIASLAATPRRPRSRGRRPRPGSAGPAPAIPGHEVPDFLSVGAGPLATKVPMPRRVWSTPARSSSRYTRATVLALTFKSTASSRTVGSWAPASQSSGGDGGANASLQLRVERRRVSMVEGQEPGHMSHCTSTLVQVKSLLPAARAAFRSGGAARGNGRASVRLSESTSLPIQQSFYDQIPAQPRHSHHPRTDRRHHGARHARRHASRRPGRNARRAPPRSGRAAARRRRNRRRASSTTGRDRRW